MGVDIDISEDNIDVGKMVLAAKYGNWEEAFRICDKKPYLINCIPEERTWGMLHQAVYWNRKDIIERLFAYPACDVLIKTKYKPPQLQEMPSSLTPKEVAQNYGYAVVEKVLSKEESDGRNRRFNQDVPFFISRIDGEKKYDTLPLFLLEIAMYKQSLLQPHTDVKLHMTDLMKKLFANEEHNWKKIETQVHNSLYGFSKVAADSIKGATTHNEYFHEMIKLYTDNSVYRHVNIALARGFKESDKNAPADDFALGLYALLLDTIINFWTDLKAFNGQTFRGVSVDVTSKYVLGQEIMFTTLTSSSKSESIARGFQGSSGTLFVINNSSQSNFRPKDISTYSIFSEEECLYAIGSEFKVTAVGNRRVELSLI